MKLLSIVLLIGTFVAMPAPPQSAQDNAADAQRFVSVLHVEAGSRIAEIGAGSGELTVALAKVVGPEGHVYSNEISADRKREIAAAIAAAKLDNVTIVDGGPADANLQRDCCDGVFMRSVYHHFADPASMNASLFRAIKAGGRIAVMDFAPNGTESRDPAGRADESHHGVRSETVMRELTAAGFIDASSEPRREAYLVVARKPPAP